MDSVNQETENNDSKQEETKVNLEEKIEEQEENFPLHRAVVKRDISKIQSLLATKKFNIDERDWHGNPPIHLAIHLRYLDVVQELLNFGSDPTVKNGGGWSALDEAIASKDKEIIKAIILAIQVKVKQEFKSRIPILIIELQKLPDFYVELKWEFKSWVPFVSRFCPSDHYKVWKRGSSLRIDTTLIGFEGLSWQRGNLSVFFFGKEDLTPTELSGQLVLVDYMNHKKEFLFDTLTNISDAELNEQIEELLKHPILKSNVETIQLTITPSKGWFGNEKYERINDFNTKVYDVVGFEYALSSRHAKPNYTPEPNDNILIPAYYFKTPTTDKKGKGYGLLYKEETITRKEKAFHGTIWFCDSFPRRAEELLPIFEILAPKIQHFQKLKHFIETKLPKESGFPIKLEVPIIPTFSATVSFLKYEEIKVDNTLFQIPSEFEKGMIDLNFDFGIQKK